MSNVYIDGGAAQAPDGTWQVGCWLSGMSETEAQVVSAWLRQLLSVHLHEVIGPEQPPVPMPTVDDCGHG